MNANKTKNLTCQNQNSSPQSSNKAILPLSLFGLAASNAFAALVSYEPYNYTLGAAPTFVSGTPTQSTGGGFSSGYNGGGLTTVAGLTYGGLGANYNA